MKIKRTTTEDNNSDEIKKIRRLSLLAALLRGHLVHLLRLRNNRQ